MDVSKLTIDMLKVPSESGNERKMALLLAKRLRKNFKVKLQKVNGSLNLFAFSGKPKIILTTHLDTVPGQLKIRADKNYIYGRGSCDAKGIIASMILACEKAKKEGYTNFGMLFDVCEETDFTGVKKSLGLAKPKFVIVGEPTNLKLVVGQKGLLCLKIICLGKAAHGATPEKGRSAINAILDILKKLREINFQKDRLLGTTSINIGTISGGTARNVIADYAEALVELRTVRPNKEIVSAIEKVAAKKNVTIESSYDPILNSTNEVGLNDLERTTVPYFTEMYFWAKKSKAFVLGPGNPRLAHTDNEAVSKKGLEKAVQIYYDIIRTNQNKK